MNTIKKKILKFFEGRNIYISRKNHPNDFTIVKRINEELIRQANGVLHIGAHFGQEAFFYNECEAPVLWFEADPHIFSILERNIATFANQTARCKLLGDQNIDSVTFHVANNEGASSSIFTTRDNDQLPFRMENELKLPMYRLDSVLSEKEVSRFKHWVIDVQGAELKVLLGAGKLLSYCNSLQVEVKNVSDYRDGSSWTDIKSFLQKVGFINLWEIERDAEDSIIFIRVNR